MRHLSYVLDKKTNCFTSFHLNIAGSEAHVVIHDDFNRPGDVCRIARLTHCRGSLRHGGHVMSLHPVHLMSLHSMHGMCGVVNCCDSKGWQQTEREDGKGLFHTEFSPGVNWGIVDWTTPLKAAVRSGSSDR